MRVEILYFVIGGVFFSAVVSILYIDFIAMLLRVTRSQVKFYCKGMMKRIISQGQPLLSQKTAYSRICSRSHAILRKSKQSAIDF